MHFTRILKELFKDYRFIFAFIVLCLLVILALMSAFSPYDPTIWFVVPRDRPPAWPHILGTNSKGQDIFWQATFAIRNSLMVSIIAGVISRIIAILIGLVAGYKGKTTDRVLMFLVMVFWLYPYS
ncbi:MAG: hypothetical protein WBK22_09990 [Halanaerobiales bacterium]